jgi:hypothetical protein
MLNIYVLQRLDRNIFQGTRNQGLFSYSTPNSSPKFFLKIESQEQYKIDKKGFELIEPYSAYLGDDMSFQIVLPTQAFIKGRQKEISLLMPYVGQPYDTFCLNQRINFLDWKPFEHRFAPIKKTLYR